MENTELIKLEQSVQIVYLNSNLWEMVFKSGEFWSTNPGGTFVDPKQIIISSTVRFLADYLLSDVG